METLYNWADSEEGVVETESWGSCRSDTCNHFTHDPYFQYFVTRLDGRVIWEGEQGERIIRSKETGRVFYTQYRSRGQQTAPAMVTYELSYDGAYVEIPDELWNVLVKRYGSPRHKALEKIKSLY